MEFLIFSDSHGKSKNIKEVIDRQIRRPDGIFFLGDGLRDLMYLDITDIPIYSVSGNCDTGGFYGTLCSDFLGLVNVNGVKVMYTHGHMYNVKSSMTHLLYTAVQKDADILLFGHTHMPVEKRVDVDMIDFPKLNKPLYIFNPGSIGDYNASFGTLTITDRGEILLSHGKL